jgi:hypothetical protein
MLGLCDLAFWQSQRKYDRGNLFDAYHLQYLQFVPEVLTSDRALLEYGQACPVDSRFRKNLKPAGSFVSSVVEEVRALPSRAMRG